MPQHVILVGEAPLTPALAARAQAAALPTRVYVLDPHRPSGAGSAEAWTTVLAQAPEAVAAVELVDTDLDFKRATLQALDQALPPGAPILTSTLAVTAAEAATWLRALIDEHRPARMNIDAGNIGAAVITQLKAMGPQYAEVVRGINFGGTSQSKLAKPKLPGPQNRRAEMYQRFLEWLELPDGAAVPDLPELQTDVTAPRLKPLPNNDFILESKVDMKKRGVRSTDLSDAVALTFASNEFFKDWDEPSAPAVYANIDNPAQPSYAAPSYLPLPSGPYGWMT